MNWDVSTWFEIWIWTKSSVIPKPLRQLLYYSWFLIFCFSWFSVFFSLPCSLFLCELHQLKTDVNPTLARNFWLVNFLRLTCVIFGKTDGWLVCCASCSTAPLGWCDFRKFFSFCTTSRDERLLPAVTWAVRMLVTTKRSINSHLIQVVLHLSVSLSQQLYLYVDVAFRNSMMTNGRRERFGAAKWTFCFRFQPNKQSIFILVLGFYKDSPINYRVW